MTTAWVNEDLIVSPPLLLAYHPINLAVIKSPSPRLQAAVVSAGWLYRIRKKVTPRIRLLTSPHTMILATRNIVSGDRIDRFAPLQVIAIPPAISRTLISGFTAPYAVSITPNAIGFSDRDLFWNSNRWHIEEIPNVEFSDDFTAMPPLIPAPSCDIWWGPPSNDVLETDLVTKARWDTWRQFMTDDIMRLSILDEEEEDAQ